jgi:hypothetical protein
MKLMVFIFLILGFQNIGLSDKKQIENKALYFLFDKSEPLMRKTETAKMIEFELNRGQKDPNPLVFVFDKNSKNAVEKITDISNYNLFYRKDILKLHEEFRVYLRTKDNLSSKIVYFPAWLETKYNVMYVIEKKDNLYMKYKVYITQPEVDYFQ